MEKGIAIYHLRNIRQEEKELHEIVETDYNVNSLYDMEMHKTKVEKYYKSLKTSIDMLEYTIKNIENEIKVLKKQKEKGKNIDISYIGEYEKFTKEFREKIERIKKENDEIVNKALLNIEIDIDEYEYYPTANILEAIYITAFNSPESVQRRQKEEDDEYYEHAMNKRD
jgi:DNA-binding ferritin-like protein